jgi:hypothetical protein
MPLSTEENPISLENVTVTAKKHSGIIAIAALLGLVFLITKIKS